MRWRLAGSKHLASIGAVAVTMTLLAAPAASAATVTVSPRPSASALFRFSDPAIAESSSLAASSFDDTFYTANDSGDTARFFRVGPQGQTLATYTLRGATNVDWEDMDTGTDANGKPVLYFADIGDNSRDRKTISVYEVPEPRGPGADVAWTRYTFAYPDGPHDAEAFLVNPQTHRMYIATKELLHEGELYAAPESLSTTGVNILTPVRPVPALTTSADFSPDGSRIVLLTYLRAYWADGVDDALHAFAVPLQAQDEAIAFTRDGSSVLIGSEGEHSAIYKVALPAAVISDNAATSPTPTSSVPNTTAKTARPDKTGSGFPSWRAVVIAAAAVLGAAALWRWLSRARR